MSVFGSILNKIFHHGTPAGGAAPGGAAAGGTKTASNQPAGTSGGTAGAAAGGQTVDVEAVLNGMEANAGQKLDWRNSIVDLMKLLNLDSSLQNRKDLAKELKYTGNTDDSASMNIWLHKQVMQKLAENGGKVPDSLKA